VEQCESIDHTNESREIRALLEVANRKMSANFDLGVIVDSFRCKGKTGGGYNTYMQERSTHTTGQRP
jgi:hypothetical protein